MRCMELTKDELDVLVKRGTPLFIKVETGGQPQFLEAELLRLIPLRHEAKTEDGQPYEAISGGDVIVIKGAVVRSSTEEWPDIIRRALNQASKG